MSSGRGVVSVMTRKAHAMDAKAAAMARGRACEWEYIMGVSRPDVPKCQNPPTFLRGDQYLRVKTTSKNRAAWEEMYRLGLTSKTWAEVEAELEADIAARAERGRKAAAEMVKFFENNGISCE